MSELGHSEVVFALLTFECVEQLRNVARLDSGEENAGAKILPGLLGLPLFLPRNEPEQREALEVVEISSQDALFFGEPY